MPPETASKASWKVNRGHLGFFDSNKCTTTYMYPHSYVYTHRYTLREGTGKDKDRKKADEGEQDEYRIGQDKGKR